MTHSPDCSLRISDLYTCVCRELELDKASRHAASIPFRSLKVQERCASYAGKRGMVSLESTAEYELAVSDLNIQLGNQVHTSRDDNSDAIWGLLVPSIWTKRSGNCAEPEGFGEWRRSW